MNNIRYIKGIILLLTLSVIFSGFLCETAHAGATWLLVDSPRASSQTGIFETDLKYTTWDAAIGAHSIAVHFDPSAIEIIQVIVPNDSEFFGNTFVDQNSFKSGTTNISAFQISNSSDITSPSTFATIQWKAISTLGSSQNISLQAKAIVDSSWRPVDVSIWGIVSNNSPIQLVNPSNSQEFTACSYFNPPVFQWVTTESFKRIEVQFSNNNFMNIAFKSKVKPGISSLYMKSALWKKLLLLPGAQGGKVYWRVVGTKHDKTTVNSNIFSFEVKSAIPVGNPTIAPTDKTALPVVSWHNNCNTKFKVWFGNSSSLTKNKSLSFSIKNPAYNGGVFTKMLTSAQWTSIRKVVGDAEGTMIYWYIEAQDILKRTSRTEVMSFVLEGSSLLVDTNVQNMSFEEYAIEDQEIWPMFRHDAQHTGRSAYKGPSVKPILKWTISNIDINSPIILGLNADVIYGTGSYDDYEHKGILGIDVLTGSVSKYTSNYLVKMPPVIDKAGILYFGDTGGNIFAINPDFSLKWKKFGYFGKNNYLGAPPTIGNDGNIYMVGNDSRSQNLLICVTPDGYMKWRYKPDRASVVSLSPAVGRDGTVYILFKEGTDNFQGGLVALFPDGTLKWKYEFGDIPTLSPVIGPDNTIYSGTKQYLYAVDPSGLLMWQIGVDENQVSMPSIGIDGTVYLDLGGRIAAIRPEDGYVAWTFDLLSRLSSISYGSSITIDSEGILYVGAAEFVYAICPDGSLKWQYHFPDEHFISPIIGKDGTIYINHENNKVSALEE